MTLYRYSGPPSGVTLNTADGPREVLLWPGQSVELPADSDYVGTLIALGHLTPAPALAAEAKTKKKGEN